jgi:hypothetical protein
MPKEHDPEKLRRKIDAGLTREQAIEVLDRQAEYDAQTARPEKKPARSASAGK